MACNACNAACDSVLFSSSFCDAVTFALSPSRISERISPGVLGRWGATGCCGCSLPGRGGGGCAGKFILNRASDSKKLLVGSTVACLGCRGILGMGRGGEGKFTGKAVRLSFPWPENPSGTD